MSDNCTLGVIKNHYLIPLVFRRRETLIVCSFELITQVIRIRGDLSNDLIFWVRVLSLFHNKKRLYKKESKVQKNELSMVFFFFLHVRYKLFRNWRRGLVMDPYWGVHTIGWACLQGWTMKHDSGKKNSLLQSWLFCLY